MFGVFQHFRRNFENSIGVHQELFDRVLNRKMQMASTKYNNRYILVKISKHTSFLVMPRRQKKTHKVNIIQHLNLLHKYLAKLHISKFFLLGEKNKNAQKPVFDCRSIF